MAWATAGSPTDMGRLTLRTKLGLLSLLLLFIPATGLRFSQLIRQDLLKSRQETMLVAASFPPSSGSASRDLYLYPLSSPIRLNGKSDDWQSSMENARWYGGEHLLVANGTYHEKSLRYRHLTGIHRDYLYTLFEVTDDRVILWPENSIHPERSDHLQIGIEDRQGNLHSYVVAARKSGWVNGYRKEIHGGVSYHLEPKIQGVWRETKTGYTVELRMPMEMVGQKLGFAVADVDDPITGEIHFLIGTARSNEGSQLGWLLSPSTNIENILKSLKRTQARIMIVDTSRRIRASYGSPGHSDSQAELATLRNHPMPENEATSIDSAEVHEALTGKEIVTSYRDPVSNVAIMAAMVPLKEQDNIVGAVVVEQSTDAILALRNKVVEESLGFSLVAFCLGGGGLIWYAFHLSARIRRLGREAGQAISHSGRIRESISPVTDRDEIGDLARILRTMLSQIKAQSEYRERMADTLQHEMRTPLAGIGAALKNMDRELEKVPHQLRDYLACARTDIVRLEVLLSSIRDATSLKQALEHDFKEEFLLDEAIDMWLIHGWRSAFPHTEFIYHRPETSISFYGDPARIRQLLEKLVENGVSFAAPHTPVELALSMEASTILLSVTNQGPPIPKEQQKQIFQSMVSLRNQKGNSPHLGLGLYIVRTIIEQYQGTISVSSIPGPDQIGRTVFTVRF